LVHDLQSERQAYAEVLEHEVKKVLRMLRRFPAERFERLTPACGASARELAGGFVPHVRLIHELIGGPRSEDGARATGTRAGIMLDLEATYLGAYLALDAMPPFRWNEVIPAPTGLSPWRQARRGELLWLALRGLARHGHHFAFHLRSAGVAEARGASAHELAPLESVTAGA
jgi:hypothetical protein